MFFFFCFRVFFCKFCPKNEFGILILRDECTSNLFTETWNQWLFLLSFNIHKFFVNTHGLSAFIEYIRSLPVTVTLEVKPADYSQIWNKIYGKSKLNSTEFKELAVLSWVLFIYLLHWFKILPEKSSKNLIERFIHKSCYLLTSIIKILNYIHGIIFI